MKAKQRFNVYVTGMTSREPFPGPTVLVLHYPSPSASPARNFWANVSLHYQLVTIPKKVTIT
jgi:hypothetical protein